MENDKSSKFAFLNFMLNKYKTIKKDSDKEITFKIENYTSTAPKSVEIYYTFKK